MRKSRLAVPAWDICWHTSPTTAHVFLPSGGGKARSGVFNQIQVAKEPGSELFSFLPGFKTDTDESKRLPSGICTGKIKNKSVVCLLMNDSCILMSVNFAAAASERSKDGKKKNDEIEECFTFTRLVEFKAGFGATEDDSGVNCSCITASGHIVTGGEDGSVRLWEVSFEKGSGACTVKQLSELKGRKGPVMALSLHPSEPWVGSASRDGSCMLWQLNDDECLSIIPAMEGLAGKGSASSTKPSPLQCRGCWCVACFLFSFISLSLSLSLSSFCAQCIILYF